MQRLKVSGVVRLIYKSLCVKGLISELMQRISVKFGFEGFNQKLTEGFNPHSIGL